MIDFILKVLNNRTKFWIKIYISVHTLKKKKQRNSAESNLNGVFALFLPWFIFGINLSPLSVSVETEMPNVYQGAFIYDQGSNRVSEKFRAVLIRCSLCQGSTQPGEWSVKKKCFKA